MRNGKSYAAFIVMSRHALLRRFPWLCLLGFPKGGTLMEIRTLYYIYIYIP